MRSETIGALAAALARAQGEMGAAPKNAANTHFRSRYADLASVLDAVRGPLARHELALVQTTEPTDYGVALTTTLYHSSGEWLSSTYPVRPPPIPRKRRRDRQGRPLTDDNGAPIYDDDGPTDPRESPQAMGSAISYAKRYAIQALLAVPSEDDDGEAAEGRGGAPQRQASRPKSAPPARREPPRDAPSRPQPSARDAAVAAWREKGRDVAILEAVAAVYSVGEGDSRDRWVTAWSVAEQWAGDPSMALDNWRSQCGLPREEQDRRLEAARVQPSDGVIDTGALWRLLRGGS